MTVLTPALHVLVALSIAAPPPADPSDCAADDLQCSARTFSAAARRAPSKAKQVEYLFFAHRSYLALSDSPGRVPARDLCQAHRLVQKALALPTTPLRSRLVESSRETLARLATNKIACTPAKRRTGNDGPPSVAVSEPPTDPGDLLASALPTEPGTPSHRPIESASSTQSSPSSDTTVAPTPSERAAVLSPNTLPTRPVGGRAETAPGEWGKQPRSPGRPLLISGGVSLAAGLALTGVAAYAGAQALGARREGHESTELEGTTENLMRNAALEDEYRRLGPIAVATGIAGGAAVVAGIVMLCVGARRKARAADSEPMLMPVRTGLLFTVRF